MKNNVRQLLGFALLLAGICSCVADAERDLSVLDHNVAAIAKPLDTPISTPAPTVAPTLFPSPDLASSPKEHQMLESKPTSSSCRLDTNLSSPVSGVTEVAIEQEFEGETINRRYLVHTPEKLDATRCYPLLFALHGIGGTPDRYPKKFSQFVENHEFIGIYPAGYKKRWNLGQIASHPNDIEFLETVADNLIPFSNIDHNRRYVHGRSNGAGMAHTLGGESDYFRAFSALVASLTTGNLPTELTRQPSVVQILGEYDELIPYKGGQGVANRIFLSGDKSANTWAQHNACNLAPEITEYNIGSYETVRTSYSGCANNGEVVSYKVINVGHGIPADRQGWLDFSTLIWDFLSRH